jgi:hypothetical protein
MTSNTKISLEKIKNLYASNLRKKGAVSTAVGWNTIESQILRFEKLTSVINKNKKSISVNDYGCGYGAHLAYLVNELRIPVDCYHGYDLSEEMIVTAKSELSWYSGSLKLLCGPEITTEADYTFVSGTFNVRCDIDETAWKNFIENKLSQIDNFSRCGFAFNLLSSYVDWKEDHLFYGDPCYWFDLCKQKFSKKVSLIHDYPLYEWTIQVKK